MPKKGAPKGPLWKFLIIDAIVVPSALALSFLVRFQEFRPENSAIYLKLILPILLIRLGSLMVFRLYNFSRSLTSFDVLYITGASMLSAHAIEYLTILYSGKYLFPSYEISQSIVALNYLFSWAGVALWRILYLERRRRWAYDRTRILIVGAGALGESVQRDIQQYSRLGHEVVGLVDDDIESRANGSPTLGKMSDLRQLVEQHRIDEIIVTSQIANRQELLDIISACQATGCKTRLLPELYEVTIGQVEIEQVAGIPLINVDSGSLSDWGVFVKRTIDIAASAITLLFLSILSPFIAIAIKTSSPGPLFYRQERIGKDGKYFTLYKFRTMYIDAETETGPVLSWEEDPRVTPVGRFLRRWHLDETPQLINVLRGEMSLVGPRPERPHFAQRFEEEIPAYRLRESVRPGMTGLAQIHGFYNSPVEHKLRYDLAYINNMSILLDLKILFLTLWETLPGHRKEA
ncbi:MAG: sugar transferase [Candidatus Omnitrophota bacterium]